MTDCIIIFNTNVLYIYLGTTVVELFERRTPEKSRSSLTTVPKYKDSFVH